MKLLILLFAFQSFANASERLKGFHQGPFVDEKDFETILPDPKPVIEPKPELPKVEVPAPELPKKPEKEILPEVKAPIVIPRQITPKPTVVVTPKLTQIYYPLHSTPLSLSSITYGQYNGLHYVIPRLQFHVGQYKFFEKLLPQAKEYLVLQPRLNFALVVTSKQDISYYVSTDNRFSLGEYGVGFKVLVESSKIDLEKTEFSGFISSYAYKNMNVGEKGRLAPYIGFHSERVSLGLKSYKYAETAKQQLFNSKNIVVGAWYQPNLFKSLSYSLESNAQNFISLSLYYGLN